MTLLLDNALVNMLMKDKLVINVLQEILENLEIANVITYAIFILKKAYNDISFSACGCKKGSLGITCDKTGKCICPVEHIGNKCEQCKEGYWGHPEKISGHSKCKGTNPWNLSKIFWLQNHIGLYNIQFLI